jgi:hypothetical protein
MHNAAFFRRCASVRPRLEGAAHMRRRREAAIRHRAGSNAIVEPFPVPLAVPNAGIPTVAPAERKIIGCRVIINPSRGADDSGAGCAVTSAAPAQTVIPVAMSDPARFRGLGCHSRGSNYRSMRARGCARRTSNRRRDHLRSRKGAWRSRQNGSLGRLRHSVWSRWIEDRRWRRGNGIQKPRLRLCMFDCYAEEGHPSGHEKLRQCHQLKSRCLHRGLR